MYWPVGAPRIYAADNTTVLQVPAVIDYNSKGLARSDGENAVEDDETLPTRRRLTINTGLANGTSSGKTPVTARKDEPSNAEPPSRTRAATTPNARNSQPTSTTHVPAEEDIGGEIIAVRPSRSGQFFTTITRTTLSVWQTKPTAVVASVLRSDSSIKSYGDNVDVMLRPDSAVVVIQTVLGYLITYTIASDPSARLYQATAARSTSGHIRRRSATSRYSQLSQDYADPFSGPGESQGVRELSLRFRMVIKLDAGISKALALEDELMVATEKPPALQCVRWVPDDSGSQATTVLLKSMPWIPKKTFVKDMVHDRPMNISVWITSDGCCFAVRRKVPQKDQDSEFPSGSSTADALSLQGYCFHTPQAAGSKAIKVAICARFSLIAVACADGQILIYTAKDYAGHVPLSHKLMAPSSAAGLAGPLSDSPGSGKFINCMLYSPDGYALFVGFADGWAMWSVYGKLGARSFASEGDIRLNGNAKSSPKSTIDDDIWLQGVREAFWIGAGSQLALLCPSDNRIWVLNLARSAVVGCYSSANVARSLLQTPTGFMIYRGYELPELGAISVETGVWHQVEVPVGYLNRQWPMRSAVTSADGRYVAVAGRRGLAHYSVASGRWKVFEDVMMEEEFQVRGGMCWHQHVLIAAVESSEGFQVS
jgi:RAB6A-GEF complex partner protein 1